ncbi:threonine synthase [Sphaerisporangium sp. NPDC088356]|uniref:threonine synthase n=1 Tax=Sphaerisporangium sp. NPDC088356 TaxID=3154871 RepID=UPI00343B7B71
MPKRSPEVDQIFPEETMIADYVLPNGRSAQDGLAQPALACLNCQAAEPVVTRTRCQRCDGYLRAVGHATSPVVDTEGRGVWRYASALADVSAPNRVSLHEGQTPLLEAGRLGAELGVDLWIKDETRNPTGSFKDRILAVATGAAVDYGAAGLVCASTGNAGASAAAYAARAGIAGVILAPAKAALNKVMAAQVFGATWISVDGDYSDAYSLALAAAAELGFMNVTTTFVSPFSVEGSKTVAYELWEEFADRTPDWIVVPIGAGPLLVGIEAGYRQLAQLGIDVRPPRLLAVQPSGCAPIVRAIRTGAEHVSAWGTPETIVGGLADPLNGYEAEGDITMAAVRRSGGSGVAIDDAMTIEYLRRLAREVGVFGEPSGAIAVAGVAQARSEGIIAAGESVVCCVTGSGLKDIEAAGVTTPRVIGVDLGQLADELTSLGRPPLTPQRKG